MRFTNNILSMSRREFKYQWYSHLLTVSILVSIFVSLLNLYGLQTKAEGAYDLYIRTYNLYQEEGMDVESMMEMPVNIIKNDNTEMIDNPVRYRFEEAEKAVQLLKGGATITQTLEWMTFIFFPIIFTLYSIYISTYDYKYETIKIKAAQFSWPKIISAKLFSLYAGVFIIFTCTLLVSYAVGNLLYNGVISSLSSEDLLKMNLNITNNRLFLQIIFSLAISLLFSTIGFVLGLLFKAALLPIIIFFVYDLIIPIIGKYDIRNMISVIAHQIFDFKGRFQLFKPVPINYFTSVSLLFFVFTLCLSLSYFFFWRQSKYSI